MRMVQGYPEVPTPKSLIQRIEPPQETLFTLDPTKELDLWLLRAGLSPITGLPRSRTGIYTDFT